MIPIKNEFLKTKNELIEEFPFFVPTAVYISAQFKEYFFENIDYLYHYTNLDGLMGIINTNGFWASHIKYMNDSKEYLHGLSLCNEVIEEYKSKGNNDHIELLNLVSKALNEEDTENFVISFCPKGDLLSQWRGYSRGQYGISIGFDYKMLHIFTTPKERIMPRKVIYDKDIQIRIIKEIIEISLANANLKGVVPFILPTEIANTLKFFIPLFKDSAFSEEKEWRIITTNQKRSNGTNKINFRVRNNIILPYVSLELRKLIKEENENLPIKKIIVGPSDSTEFTMESIKHFLKEKNYHNSEVIRSIIPYR